MGAFGCMHPVHVETFRVIFHSRSGVERKIAFWLMDFLEKRRASRIRCFDAFWYCTLGLDGYSGVIKQGPSHLGGAAERESEVCFLNAPVFFTAVVARAA